MLWTIQQTQVDVRFTKIQQTFSKMNALRRQNIRPQQTFERWTLRTQESPRELVCQSEAKRKQAPQSEASVCQQWKCNLKKKRPLLIAQDTQHKLGVAFEVRERNYRLKGIHVNIEMQITRFLKVLSQILLFQQKRLYNSPWVFFLKMNLFLIRGINRR